MTINPPPSKLLRRGAQYGQHVLPSDSNDQTLRAHVEAVFYPQPMFPGRPCKPPRDPELVQQLLNYAPQPDQLGADDWGRPLRADEHAEIWGNPMEGPDVRKRWLQRADEVCRAHGQPLFGPGGLRPDLTVED